MVEVIVGFVAVHVNSETRKFLEAFRLPTICFGFHAHERVSDIVFENHTHRVNDLTLRLVPVVRIFCVLEATDLDFVHTVRHAITCFHRFFI